MWVVSCVFKFLLVMNAMSHLEQENGFSPVWIPLCLFNWPLSANDLLHNGFSPVWILLCFFKLLLSVYDLSHYEEANGLFLRIGFLTSVGLFMKKVDQTPGYTLCKSEVNHQCGFVHDKDYPNFLSHSCKNEVVLFSLYTVSVLC